jgi:hypothetical protein
MFGSTFTGMSINKKRKKIGRPSLGRDGKNIVFQIKVSANELAEWRKAAKDADMSLGSWLLKPRRDEREKQR